jgi:hypothetical protein
MGKELMISAIEDIRVIAQFVNVSATCVSQLARWLTDAECSDWTIGTPMVAHVMSL